MSNVKKAINIIVALLFVGYVLTGVSRFGIPTKAIKGDESIFADIYIDIPEKQMAYISYFPHFSGIYEGFNYEDDIDNPRTVVNIYETSKDDWQTKITGEVNQTELPVENSIFQADSNAQVIGVPSGSSSCDLFIRYREKYYFATVTGTTVKNPSDALSLLGRGVFSLDND